MGELVEEAQDTLEHTAPWQIKAMPVEVRKRAVACAGNAGLSVAEWVAQAVNLKARMDQGEHVLPPSGAAFPGAAVPYGALPAQTSGFAEPPAVPVLDLAGLAQLLAQLGTMSDDGLRRDAVRTTRAMLRQARGLPPVRGRARPA